MAKEKKFISIYGSVQAADAARVKARAQAAGKAPAIFVREAILFYLNYQDKEKESSRETLLERRMKRMEDRLASLQVKTAIDVGAIYSLLWQNSNYQSRDEQFIRARKHSVDRLRKKLKDDETDIKERVTRDD